MSNEELYVFCLFLSVVCFALMWGLIILRILISEIKEPLNYLYEELKWRNKNND